MARKSMGQSGAAARGAPYSAQWLGEQLAQAHVEPSAQIGFSRHEPGRRGPLVTRADYDLHYILDGALDYVFPHFTLRAKAGCFCLTPPRVPLREVAAGAGRRGVSLDYAHFQVVSPLRDPLLCLNLPAVVRAPDPREAAALFDRLLQSAREARAGEGWARLRTQGDLLRLLALVFEAGFRQGALCADPRRAGPAWLWPALEAIERGLERPELDVNELARAAHLSPSHFAHEFRRHAGFAPMQLLLRKRMERACVLLVSPEALPIKEIALRCGFTDPYHFSAQFKKWARVSPSDYRRSEG